MIKEHISSENVFESSDHTHMDMLSLMILSATDRENNEIMSKQQIIDETYTFVSY
jgi:cytochrome P450